MPGGVSSPVRAFRSVGGTPFFTKKADGALLTTADGKELIDFVCTWGPAIHGHNAPAIREALNLALEQGTSFGTPNSHEIELAELIVRHVPSIEKVRFCNSGTEATMSALRLARGFTGRDKIIKFAGCYHGHVDSLLLKAGSGAVTLGCPDSAGIPASFARETLVLPLNDIYALKEAFLNYGASIAAVIIEPYPANAGLILPQQGFLQELRRLCTENKSLLIFDEVMTGFRIGLGGVQELVGITPDITALGKIIGGGLPVGAFGANSAIMDYLAPIGPVYQAGTLSGNPLAMAAGTASLSLLEQATPYGELELQTRFLVDSIREAARQKGLSLHIPQAGSMFAFFFTDEPVCNFDQATASQKGHYVHLFQYALDHGVYLPPSPYETCFLSTAHTPTLIEKAATVLLEAIRRL